MVLEIFKVFAFGCHGNQSSAWNSILWTIFVKICPRNIPVKFQVNRTSGFREEDVDGRTQGRGPIWPQGHNLNNFHRRPLDDATNQISRLYALWFWRRRFLKFSLYVYIKNLEPPGRGPIWPQGHDLNNFHRGTLDDASHQISSL